jgi:O-succinylbenzoate synthase
MKIKEFNIFKYNLPFIKPFKSSKQLLLSRSGLILQIGDCMGNSGWGEIAPFPGLSLENLDEAMEQLGRCIPLLKNITLDEQCIDWENEFIKQFGETLFPSVSFGLESALIDLLTHVRKKNIAELIYDAPSKTIFLNGLLDGSDNDLENQLLTLMKNGYRSLKIKIGCRTIPDEIEKIQQISSVIKNKISLRLDANQSWSLSQAIEFARKISDIKIDYIEEPVKNKNYISKFYRETHMPVALDDSLSGNIKEIFNLPEGVVALVIKPGIRGGIVKGIDYARVTLDNGIQPIFSCPFYSGIGLSMIFHLSAGFSQNNVAMGLDTLKWFKEDIMKQTFPVKNGIITLEKVPVAQNGLKTELLRPVQF